MPDITQLLQAALKGERAAQARLLSVIERADEHLLSIENTLAPLAGKALVVGITGPPGAGKSTLINRLIPHALHHFGRAAVLAIDPSSPFSDGALLGDRVRMLAGSLGESVFIRSMASRGEEGGMARATATAVRLFDACDWPVIIIETLGIGQVELDIMDLADTVVVVLNPGWGDEIQANKAGLTEAGDVFAINKADKPGAEQTRRDLFDSVTLSTTRPVPEIVSTVAIEDDGVADLWRAINAHQQLLLDSGKLEERRNLRRGRMTRKILSSHLIRRLDNALDSAAADLLLERVMSGDLEMGDAAEQVMTLMAQAKSTK